MRRGVLVLATSVLLPLTGARGEDPQLFPFVLPWDDRSPGVTDLSGWLHRPAGKFGPVRASDDGHLQVGTDRIRFFGVNVCFGANFPRKEDADKIAARMAKFGTNVVRFHHLDMLPFPAGIRARGAAGTGELDPEALDRLDHFLARLKDRGIYANLNLLVTRPFNKADGLPAEIERLDPKERHVVGFFHEPALKLQKGYARRLLTHRNPHTGLTYAEDPAVAFVEINNENGLVHAWLGRQVDALPEVFLRDLRKQWNGWLRQQHATTADLRRAWDVKHEPLGAELLTNTDFARGLDGWVLERHDKAQASAEVSDDVPAALKDNLRKSVRVKVDRAAREGWHVQLNQRGIKVQANRPYTVSFWARSDRPLKARLNVGQAHDPWKNLGLEADVALTEAWKEFRFVFVAGAADDNARLNFTDLGRQAATVWLAGVSFRTGGTVGMSPDERLEDGSLPLFPRARFGERTAEAQRDWLRFLWETEEAYWLRMRNYLKTDLKVAGVVIGTIVGCSTPNLMALLDAVDTHAYWQHPHFPGRQWDGENWIVHNRTMVNEPGGTLPGLALRRVFGRPHNVTEYNHPAPNTYGSEGFLLLAAYGAFQDWDAIYAFAYSQSDRWDSQRIGGFFDIDQHPTKMATLPAAAALFVRGDVRPARHEVLARLYKDQEIELLRKARPWELVHAGHTEVAPTTALVHRVALFTDSVKLIPVGAKADTSGPRYAADTGELLWDLSETGKGVVTVDTPRSKAVIGYGGGKRFDLGGVVVEPGRTVQDGWCAVTVTVMDGKLPAGPARLLVTATGTTENTGMKWKTAARDSVGRDWGKAPSLVEGVPVRLTLPVPPDRVRAWALDGRGQRAVAQEPMGGDGKTTISLGPGSRTLWYEVEMKPHPQP